jgi:hypothetical protein
MNALHKLIMKKKGEGKDLSPEHAEAKSSMLEKLMGDMDSMGADKLKGLKKVTVASNSPKGLEMGLSKAKDLVKKPEMMDEHETDEIDPEFHKDGEEEMSEDEESPEHESMESPALEASEHEMGEDMSEDELRAKIRELEAKLNHMKA